MAKESFREKNFRIEARRVLHKCDDVITDYVNQGYRVTLRQLYYVFISNDFFPADWIDEEYNRKHGLPLDTKNTPKNYKKFGDLVSEGRLAGLLDWEAIEDRGRQPKSQTEFEDLKELARAAVSSYRLPRWKGQDSYVELWVEKDALAGVLSPLAREFHVTMMVNKGYSSQSAMHESAQRFVEAENEGRSPIIFYLGDMDPSGEDMVRDIRERLTMFGVEDMKVRKIALNMDQIRKFKPPPNPAKITDPRAAKYIDEFGDESWEVDALPPNILNKLIKEAFISVLDMRLMDTVIAQEEKDKKRLLAAVSKLA